MASWKPAEPASSLAAQLAPRLSSQGDQAQHLTREAFSQLRHELVGGRYSQLQFDDSVGDASKLICIVLKAGLEPASHDGKRSKEDLEGQILDCLDIIQAAVDKAPQALTQTSDSEILGEGIHAPLFAWLIVRLLGLGSGGDSEKIEDAVYDTLSKVLHTQSKRGQSRLPSQPIMAFLQACAAGLYRLEHSCETAADAPQIWWSRLNPSTCGIQETLLPLRRPFPH